MQGSKEIGSEFWLESEPEKFILDRDATYVLSGRTAIDIIIQNIMAVRNVKSVCLPAYCCESMIDPFVRRGIEVSLYDISYDGNLHYHIDEKYVNIFYVNNYFGYENTISSEIIQKFKEKGTIIIYDKTHSLFMSNDKVDELADYSFASIRKWMGVISGAVVYKTNGTFTQSLKDYPFLQCKCEAMREKALFINGDPTVDKQTFLSKYGEFAHHLTEDYQDYVMDELSFSIWSKSNKVDIRNQRRENAAVLHMERNLQFISELTSNACPIFVPVFFENSEQRNAVRKALIDAKIYCPIHWPKNSLITSDMKVNEIFDRELSLICDQRYSTDDMNRIIEIIKLNIN